MRDDEQGFEVIETEGSPIAPCAGLIFEWAGEGRCRRAEEGQAAGVTVELARAVCLVGASRSVIAGGYNKNPIGCGAIKPAAR